MSEELAQYGFQIKVKLRLAQEQFVGLGKWEFTHAGAKKLVDAEWVEYYANSMNNALRSFDTSEVIEILIRDESAEPIKQNLNLIEP